MKLPERPASFARHLGHGQRATRPIEGRKQGPFAWIGLHRGQVSGQVLSQGRQVLAG